MPPERFLSRYFLGAPLFFQLGARVSALEGFCGRLYQLFLPFFTTKLSSSLSLPPGEGEETADRLVLLMHAPPCLPAPSRPQSLDFGDFLGVGAGAVALPRLTGFQFSRSSRVGLARECVLVPCA